MKKILLPLFVLAFIALTIQTAFAQCTSPPNAIYVTANGTGTGTAASPTNLLNAINMYIANNARKPILMAGGTHYLYNTIKLPSGIVIEGSYLVTGSNWQKDPSFPTTLNINPPFKYDTLKDILRGPVGHEYVDTVAVAHIIGLQLDSVRNIILRDFNIYVWNNNNPYLDNRDGNSVYAVHAYKTQNVQLVNMELATGDAQSGGFGSDGRNGYSAVYTQAGGLEVDEPHTTNIYKPVYKIVDESNPVQAGGAGGFGGPVQQFVPCQSFDCLERGCELEDPAPMGQSGGGNIDWPSGGAGGACGDACKLSCYYESYANYLDVSIADIYNAVVSTTFPLPEMMSGTAHGGANGMDGLDGESFNGTGYVFEYERYFVPATGEFGRHGKGGTGGGGGGAGGISTLYIPDPPPGVDKIPVVGEVIEFAVKAAQAALLGITVIGNAAGGDMCNGQVLNLSTPGGPGGGGGEGGEGGHGGGGGGAVYGIFTYQCTGIATGNVRYSLGEPGTGGSGGFGGSGGVGAFGLEGPDLHPWFAAASYRGAQGGKGGRGGAGGYGQEGGPGVKRQTWRINDPVIFAIDTSRLCTNTIIGLTKNAASTMGVYLNNASANVTTISDSPTFREVSVSSTGNLHIVVSNNNNPNAYAMYDYTISRQRPLPAFSIAPKICRGDTVSLAPSDTSLGGYLWTIRLNDGTLLKQTRERSFKFYPPNQTGNVTYKVFLQTFDACCGWSTPAEHWFTIEQPLTLVVTAPFNTYPFCEGTDSTRVVLTGAPVVVTGSFPNYIYTYPGVTWNTGATNVDKIYAKASGTYSVTYTSPIGCITHSQQNAVISNIWPLPTSVPVTPPVTDGCDFRPLALTPHAPESWSYDFYQSATATTPIPNGYHTNNYTFTPFFDYGVNLKDSIVIYVAAVNQYGCVGLQRGKAVVFHERNLPGYIPPLNLVYYETAEANICGKHVNYEVPTPTDDCTPFPTVTRISGLAPGAVFPVGVSTVVHRITDGFGNFRDITTYITVNDVTPPVISVSPDINLNATTGTCGAVWHLTPATGTDNCQQIVVPSTFWSGHNTGDTLFGVGTTQFTYVFTDPSGFTTVGHTNITVNDNQVPVVNCPADKTYYIAGSDTAVFTFYNRPTGTDNCDITGLYPTLTSGFGQIGWHPLGSTSEVWTLTDNHGNTGNCSFNLTVTDSIAPVITCPDPVFFVTDPGLPYATINYTTPTATDNLAGVVSITQLSGKASGDTASIGIFTATWQATDIYGNSATCPVKITVSDREGPVLVCPNNVTTVNNPGQCTATVNYTVAPALDNDLSYYTPNLAFGQASGTAFPFGTTNVVYTVADAQNNKSYCSFNITVIDNVLPVFTTPCPHDTTININPLVCGAQLTPPVMAGTDNSCFAPSVGFVSGSFSGFYELGTTTQLYQIRDHVGNTRTCSYNVTVVDNNNVTVTCPPNITRDADAGSCTAYIPNYGTPVITPFYGGACLTTTVTNAFAPYFPVGTVQVTYNVLVNGHTAACAFQVTVNDNQYPQISAPASIEVAVTGGTCGAIVNFTEPVGTDNCTNGLGTFRITGQAPGTLFPVGTTVQTYVVGDVVGHLDTAVFTITVRDTIAPVIAGQANITDASSDMCGKVMTFIEPVGTDNSSCVTTTRVSGIAPGDWFPIGTTTQVYVATDAAGNTDTLRFDVIVNPIYPLQAGCMSHSLQPDPNGNGLVVYYPLPGTVDQWTGQLYPCPGITIILEEGQGSGAFFTPGPHLEKYAFIINGTGDTVRCTTNVVVTEFNPPLIDCGPVQTYNLTVDSGLCTASFYLPVPTVSDGPPGSYINLTHKIDGVPDTSTVYTFGPGFHYIDYRATDYSSNSSYCTIYVKVTDDVQIANPFNNVTYCQNDVVNIDPQLIGSATGLTYQWITTDSLSNYITFSTDKVLHFDAVKLSDQRQYSFRVTDRCGAVITGAEFLLTVTPATATTLTGLNANYCIYDSADVTVSFSPAGGVLAGNGITTNKFNPKKAGVGTHEITYSWYNANTGCTGVSKKTVVVNAKPVADLFADSVYCINTPTIQLPATNSTYTGVGISGGTMFNPATAGGGYHLITRTVNINGCTAQRVQNIRINTVIPNPNITAPSSVCEATGVYTLTAATSGGIWTGTYVTADSVTGNGLFNSRATGFGSDTIIYTITQSACTARDTAIINVRSKAYNLPYTFHQFCATDAPVMFDTTDGKKYIGLGFTNATFDPSSLNLRGPLFYAVVTTNNFSCKDTVYRMMNLRGGQLNIYNPQFICERGDSLVINLRNEYDSIRWWNGSSSNIMLFTDTGRYAVFLRDTMGCYGRDTMRIGLYPAPADTDILAGPSSVYACPGTSATLTTDAVYKHYLWSNGDTTRSIDVTAGTYRVTVTTNRGCQYPSPLYTVTTGTDAILPTITCPADTTFFAPESSCAVSGVAIGMALASDNCGILSVTSNAPVNYFTGVTNVIWTARDSANNIRTCVQHVTVNDSIKPYFTGTPTDIFVADSNAQNNCSSVVPDVTGLFSAGDSCSTTTLTQNPPAGTLATTGLTTVQVIAQDPSGNSVSFYMYYQTQDTVTPVVNCPANITVSAVSPATTKVVIYTAPTQASNCSNSTVQRISGLGSGAAFPVGVTTEKYVVTDGVGATDTCSFTITVSQVTGIEERTGNNSTLTVMPVPALDRLTIVYTNATTNTLQVRLTSTTGQLLFSEQTTSFNGSYNKTIDVSSHPAGTYILEMVSDNEIVTRKIVKL